MKPSDILKACKADLSKGVAGKILSLKPEYSQGHFAQGCARFKDFHPEVQAALRYLWIYRSYKKLGKLHFSANKAWFATALDRNVALGYAIMHAEREGQ